MLKKTTENLISLNYIFINIKYEINDQIFCGHITNMVLHMMLVCGAVEVVGSFNCDKRSRGQTARVVCACVCGSNPAGPCKASCGCPSLTALLLHPADS